MARDLCVFSVSFHCKNCRNSVADPEFPREGEANCKGEDINQLFWPTFPRNCMNMKTFGPRWGPYLWCPFPPLVLPMRVDVLKIVTVEQPFPWVGTHGDADCVVCNSLSSPVLSPSSININSFLLLSKISCTSRFLYFTLRSK